MKCHGEFPLHRLSHGNRKVQMEMFESLKSSSYSSSSSSDAAAGKRQEIAGGKKDLAQRIELGNEI
jgi:hypothetical protein